MRRTVVELLCTVALLFVFWEAYATIRWVVEAGTLAWAFDHFWSALQSDWMAKIVVSDHLFIAGTVLVALWFDAARMDWGVWRRLTLALAFIALGTPALLTYIAWRLGTRSGAVVRPDRESPVMER
jgi:hypothetical protein